MKRTQLTFDLSSVLPLRVKYWRYQTHKSAASWNLSAHMAATFCSRKAAKLSSGQFSSCSRRLKDKMDLMAPSTDTQHSCLRGEG